jgi:hypothetical protein
MKPTTDFDATLLDNAANFDAPFYKRFSLRHAPKPLRLNETIEKDYLFPTFYGDVTCAMGIFLCSYEKAERMMIDPQIKPVRMPRGRSIVAFSCYEYKQVLGVAPYNEIAMTIPVMAKATVNPPILPMVLNGLPGFGYYVFSMPVTSLENQIRGRKIWGLPKVVEEIDLREEGTDCITTAKEATGETYFTLRVPTTGKPERFDVRSNLYSKLDGTILRSETSFASTFAVTKYMGELLKTGTKPARPFLTLSDTPSGRTLKELDIEEHPFQLRFARHMTSCFDLPDPTFRF